MKLILNFKLFIVINTKKLMNVCIRNSITINIFSILCPVLSIFNSKFNDEFGMVPMMKFDVSN